MNLKTKGNISYLQHQQKCHLCVFVTDIGIKTKPRATEVQKHHNLLMLQQL